MAYLETSRSRVQTDDKHTITFVHHGVALSIDDTNVPLQGKVINTNASPTNAITDAIIQRVEQDPVQQAGRVVVRSLVTTLRAFA